MAELDFFCEEYERGYEPVIETDLWRVRWDGAPATPGHALVLPKRHAQYFEELTDAEIVELMPLARKTIEIIRHTDLRAQYEKMLRTTEPQYAKFLEHALGELAQRCGGPDAFNFGVNDGPEAGQSIPHFHFHIMPRWKGDMPNPRGGVRNLFRDDTYGEL